MRSKCLYGIVALAIASLMAGCKGDLANAGESILEADDEILVKSDTFNVSSTLCMSPGVISIPDSLLVGEIETRFGTLRASAMTQLSCPEGFRYPENAVIDSVCLFVYYSSWTGDGNSALGLRVYEMDKATLEYSPDEPYLTRLDVGDYCSMSEESSVLQSARVVVAQTPKDSVYQEAQSCYVPALRFRLSDSFAERFTQVRSFTTQAAFNEFFGGLYIVSDYGGSTVLNMQDVSVGVYYHFTYPRIDTGRDTTVTDVKGFYANSEVRQVNIFEYLNDKGDWLEQLRNEDTCYMIAPAGVYTTLSLPMGLMDSTIMMSLGDKRPYVNKAELRVDVLENEKGSASWMSAAQNVLLMKDMSENAIESFFTNHELPNDTSAILSTLGSETDSLGIVRNYYSFDISTLLTKQLRQTNNPDTLRMTIVPVSISTTTTNSSTLITSVKQSQTLSATMIRSAQNSEQPMTLKVVYSGF